MPTNWDLVARLTLVRPSLAFVASHLEFIEEMSAVGDTIWPSRLPRSGEELATFVARLFLKETAPEPPAVPESVHWGVVDDRVVGFIALRHQLNEQLAKFGGHIGYEVRPSCRRQGVATAMLRLLLVTERAQTLRRILVTCAPSNAGSRKTIEANGGLLESIVFVDEVQRETCRYWIDVEGGR
ncbi:MAG: GNAT family N-acetyltransferase [Deltaproteobacteria bacterium]|nr:GNAT family N-acetyltransferase [Deltaproteobacteria bacterium]